MRGAADVARGLEAARAPRPIEAGERIHVIGAAGAGASAAALLAHAAGAAVSGCDPSAPTPYTAALEAAGVVVAVEHDPAHVGGAARPARLAVTKALTAVDPDHPELVAARAAGIPVEPWQQTVADAAASQGGRLVAVAGTHGKSTSAGWLVHVLADAGRDPGAFVGALLPARLSGGVPATARWGRGPEFVVEADEYAGNFDPYRPALAVVLNAEWDHPDVFADRAAVVDAFAAWLRAPGAEGRVVVVNTGDAGGLELARGLAGWPGAVVSVARADEPEPDFGFEPVARVRWALRDGRLEVYGLPAAAEAEAGLRTRLQLGGAHNAANAACVAAAAAALGLAAEPIAAGLAAFAGVARRLEVKGEPGGVLVIDDYGHHPGAIRATLEAVRERYPGRRVWIAHEPLTYHRAAAMADELAAALALADEAVVADIWAGRDPDTSIASAADLAGRVAALSGRPVAAPGSPEATAEHLAARVVPGDIVLAMGGGRSYVIAERLVVLLGTGDGSGDGVVDG